jgi:hypothetical protein
VSGTGIGGLAWALVTFIPSWRQAIPPDLLTAIPWAAGIVSAVAASYRAPHTHRPDLPGPVPAGLLDAVRAAVSSAIPPPGGGQMAVKGERLPSRAEPPPPPEPVLAQEPPAARRGKGTSS